MSLSDVNAVPANVVRVKGLDPVLLTVKDVGAAKVVIVSVFALVDVELLLIVTAPVNVSTIEAAVVPAVVLAPVILIVDNKDEVIVFAVKLPKPVLFRLTVDVAAPVKPPVIVKPPRPVLLNVALDAAGLVWAATVIKPTALLVIDKELAAPARLPVIPIAPTAVLLLFNT